MRRQSKLHQGRQGLWGRGIEAVRRARQRRHSSQRVSLIERLEPRVVLNGAPVAMPDPWYTTPQNTTLTVTTQGTTLVANDWDPEGRDRKSTRLNSSH